MTSLFNQQSHHFLFLPFILCLFQFTGKEEGEKEEGDEGEKEKGEKEGEKKEVLIGFSVHPSSSVNE